MSDEEMESLLSVVRDSPYVYLAEGSSTDEFWLDLFNAVSSISDRKATTARVEEIEYVREYLVERAEHFEGPSARLLQMFCKKEATSLKERAESL